MSGAGRKHRAKHLTRQFLDDDAWCGLQGAEQLAVSMGSPSGKHLHVYLLLPRPAAQAQGTETTTTVEPSSSSPTAQFSIEPAVVHLPGKFHKVMWIAAKDVLVIVDNFIDRKLSPAQLENFLNAFPEWKSCVAEAVAKTEEGRQLKGAPQVGFAPANTQQAQTSNAVSKQEEADDEQEEVEATDDDDDIMGGLGNPNRNSIKHRQAAFLEDDEEEEEEEECEED